ncbi:hypothetical protein L1987_60725 [Smallanthus sonchifolius]|uniref:Uncharacterized protein n=1 Tax=Smallanthus sonchifolius TaxID=185202 RepID=A0ACB9D8V2_9ASTR|nr:hypothetical protein L1987_60725 [Smallanthus sonchifolius]
MRCKKHYTDLSSAVGVCACCLRERLLSLIAAQEEAQAQAQVQNLDGKHCNSEKNPAFPRSVSPYVHNRKRNQSDGAVAWSDNNSRKDHHPYPLSAPRHRHSLSDQPFYTTPQIGPTSGGHNTGVDSNKKRSFIRFLSFSNIFRSRNRKSADSVSDLRESDSTFREQCGGGNATSSPSLFSSIVHGRRHRRKQPDSVDESTVSAAGGGAVRRQACRDRGMSPVRNSDVDELNNAASEYESTESWRNTPRRTPARRGGGGGHARNLSGLTFCLSPMVRASPNRQWNQKGLPPDVVSSSEIRAPVNPHLSNTKSFHANRSRKLADFGRPNQNR